MAARIRKLIQDFTPAPVKEAIKRSSLFELRSARNLAATNKRIDICATQVANLLHLSSIPSLRDLVCLEVGAGWVLTHALVFHLLGAKKVIATDVEPHAHPGVLRESIKQSIASLTRDVLASFADHSFVRERLNNLMSIRTFSFDTLKSLGIEYISPVDLASRKMNVAVDFIYSLSVLEHVPCDDVAPLLANLSEMLTPRGAMLHAIHLEDHRDFNIPFEFLSMPGDSYSRLLQTNRGNRIRCSEWRRLFSEIPQTSTKPIYTFHRRDRPLPKQIDRSVRHLDEDDLRVSHLGMLTQRRP